MSKRRQRSFAISHAANKRPKYFHDSGLQLLSSSSEDINPTLSTTPSASGSSCPQCAILNNEIKWLRSRIEKYEERLQTRLDKLDQLLLSTLNEHKVDNINFDFLPLNSSPGLSFTEDIANFGGAAVPSVESQSVSLVAEASVPLNVSSDDFLSSTNVISVDDDNDNCV